MEEEQKDKDQEMWLRCGVVIGLIVLVCVAGFLPSLVFFYA